MANMVSFFIAVIIVMVLALFYLNERPAIFVPGTFENAEVSDRCAKFREVNLEDKDIFSLGYKGRVRQILSGCF